MEKSTPENYDRFYEGGGWEYDANSECLFLIYRILKPLRIPPKGELLELGCGTGVHAAIFQQLDYQVTALDASKTAIEKARSSYPDVNFLCEDAHSFLLKVPENDFDVVFVRGLSWFHYELGPGENKFGVNVHDNTDSILRILRPNGFFILQIRTDFSGRQCPDTGIHNHTWYDLMGLLEPRGELLLFTDWNGLPLTNAETARRSGQNALCGLRKI